jgi:hypothetical protein
MNFDHMPELHWVLGYPFALALMVTAAGVAVAWFAAATGSDAAPSTRGTNAALSQRQEVTPMTIQPPPDSELPEEREPDEDSPSPPTPEPGVGDPGLRAPGPEDPPMRMPRDSPDVETEI